MYQPSFLKSWYSALRRLRNSDPDRSLIKSHAELSRTGRQLLVISGVLAVLFVALNLQIYKVWLSYEERLGDKSAAQGWLEQAMTSDTLATYDMVITMRRLEALALRHHAGMITTGELNLQRRQTNSMLVHFEEESTIATNLTGMDSFDPARNDARAYLEVVEQYEKGQVAIQKVVEASEIATQSWTLLKSDTVVKEFEIRDGMKKTIGDFLPIVSSSFQLVALLSVLCGFAVGFAMFLGLRSVRIERERYRRFELMVASIGHDLRTPVHLIRSTTGLISSTVSDIKRKGFEAQLLVATKTLARLVDDIMRVVRQEPLSIQVEPVRIDQWFVEFVALYAGKAKEKGLTLVASSTVKGLVLTMDPDRITQCIGNLVDNAIKYTTRGTINVRVWIDSSTSDARDDQLVFLVQDTGRGIAKVDQKRIFQPFERVFSEKPISGMGLGLAIVQRLVESCGGTLNLQSTPGLGSAFKITIPAVRATISEAIPPSTKSDELRPEGSSAVLDKGSKILIVDDHAPIRETLIALITEIGYVALGASSAMQALSILESENIHLLLTDIQMPDIDGVELAQRVKALGLPCKIVAMTANPEILQTRNATNLFAHVLAKPFANEALFELLELCSDKPTA